MNPADTSRHKQLITALAVLLAIVVIVGATVVAAKKNDTSKTADTKTTSTPPPSSSSSGGASGANGGATNSSGYKNGTYSAESTYNSPGGSEGISVRVTIKNGVVTDSSVTTDPTEREAEEYQQMFVNSYETQVVGKSIDSISLSRVSGSSLTSAGFNDALDKIKQQAQSAS